MLLVLNAVSEAPKAAPAPKKYQSYNPDFKTDEEKKEEVSPLYLYSYIPYHGILCWYGDNGQTSYSVVLSGWPNSSCSL